MSDTKQIPMYELRLIAHLSEAMRHVAEGCPKQQIINDVRWALTCLEESEDEPSICEILRMENPYK